LSAEFTGATNRRFATYDRSSTTGLDYALNRHYDPQQGRFTQVDPIGMKATSLLNPQTLNLYAYCTNDPVNNTDPSGLGFFSWLGKLFKGIGKVLSAVGNAIARVLNNRWVRIGVFILGFILPGLQALSSILYKIVDMGLKIYNKIADIVSMMQLAGMALQGKMKEFWTSVGLGLVSSLFSQVTTAVQKHLQDTLFKGKYGGNPFKGFWEGLKAGFGKLRETIKHAFEKLGNLVPWFGNYCSSAATDSNASGTGIDGYDDKVCRPHDIEYQRDESSITDEEWKRGIRTKNDIRRVADWKFVRHAIFGFGDPSVTSFDIAFSGQYGGRPMIGSVHKFFSVPAFVVFGTVRGL
jgi:RHS repeat-associated protein